MICNVCGKNVATIHVTELIDGKMVEIHLCETCAKEKEVNTKIGFSINELLNGLMKFTSDAKGMSEQLTARCPGCDLSIKDLQKKSRVGCMKCYETFSQFLLPLIGKIHGATQHCGKKPSAVSERGDLEGELKRLEEQLQLQVQKEAFEEAAMTRDAIRALKEQIEQAAGEEKKSRKTPRRNKKKKE